MQRRMWLCILLASPPAVAEGWIDRLDARVGASGVLGTAETTSVKFGELEIGMAVHATPRLTLHLEARPGLDRFDLQSRVDDTMTSSGTLSGVSMRVGAGVGYTLLDQDPFSIEVFGRVAASAVKQNLTIDELRVTTPEGDFKVTNYLKKHSQFSMSLTTYAAGVTTRFRLGRFTPRMTISFNRIDAAIDTHIYPDAQELLGSLGHDPTVAERRHALAANAIGLTPGLDIRCTDRFWVSIEAGGLALGDHWLLVGGIVGLWKFDSSH